MTSRASVLVVEDDEKLADLYAVRLRDEYDVEVAYSGEAALDVVDAGFDVVLLDRRMGETSGDEVLDRIRARNVDCRVAMVTAVDPGMDVASMAVDDYLVKPVSGDDMVETVETLVERAKYDERRRELSSKKVRRNILRVEKSPVELERSEEFQALLDRIEELEAELSEMDHGEPDRESEPEETAA